MKDKPPHLVTPEESWFWVRWQVRSLNPWLCRYFSVDIRPRSFARNFAFSRDRLLTPWFGVFWGFHSALREEDTCVDNGSGSGEA